MLAAVADEVRAIGQNLVAVGRARLRPHLCQAVCADTIDDAVVNIRDVNRAISVHDGSLAIAGHFNDFDSPDVVLWRKPRVSECGGYQDEREK